MAYVRTVKTASGARAVQIVHSSRRGSRDIEHIGSAHDDAALEALKAVARQRLAVGQPELDFGPDFAALQAGSGAGGGPLAITSSRMGYLRGRARPRLPAVGGSRSPLVVTRCSDYWCRHGSSSRPASWTVCG